jgi:hypothetical protein
MMLVLKVHVNPSDVRRAKDAFKKVGETADDALGAALYAEANRALNISRPLVPVDTGVLRGSGVVLQPERMSGRVRVVFGYGGAAKAYAVVQHENERFKHRVGQAKYLSEGVRRSLPGASQRVAADIRSRLH